MKILETYIEHTENYFQNKWKQDEYWFTAGDEDDLYNYIVNNDIDFEDDDYYIGQNILIKVCDINPHQISEYIILKLLKIMFNKGGLKYINTQDHVGNTCLILSAYHERYEVVRFLLDNGANWNIMDKNNDDFIEFIPSRKRSLLNEYPEEYTHYLDIKKKNKKIKKFNL